MPQQHSIVNFDSEQLFANREYDRIVRLIIPGYEALHMMTLSLLETVLSEVANLLIVGVGTGMELCQLGPAHPSWRFLGVDPSESMLTLAKQKIERCELTERVEIYQGFVDELPTARLYDAATCILVMHFMPDDASKLALLQSIAQRLRPNACFILADIFGDKNTKSFERLTLGWQRYGQNMGIPSTQIDNILATANSSVSSISEPRVIELLHLAGFNNIDRFFSAFWYGAWIATKN